MRPTFQTIFMTLAESLSERATCKRLKVGAVITTDDFQQVLSIGYNGNAKGAPNTCDSDEPGKCGCLHAEENAIIKCSSPSFVPKIIFVTHKPCVMCAKRIINLGGVQEVIYKNDYRGEDSSVLLEQAGVKVTKYTLFSEQEIEAIKEFLMELQTFNYLVVTKPQIRLYDVPKLQEEGITLENIDKRCSAYQILAECASPFSLNLGKHTQFMLKLWE